MMGTPDYIASEQLNDARSADIRADLYSLGCSLYHLLTGRPPFAQLPVLQKLLAHLAQIPEPVSVSRPEVPGGLVAVLDRLLAKDPAQRHQRPAEVAQALAKRLKTRTGHCPCNQASRTSPAVHHRACDWDDVCRSG